MAVYETLPVLIVGAGPSGLMMAHELARFGVSCVIIDKAVSHSHYSRAIGVQIRTLEIFKALGLYEKLKEKSWPVKGVRIYAEKRSPISIDLGATSSSLINPLIIDQTHTEATLESAVLGLGQKVLWQHELVQLSQNDDGTVATIKDSQGGIQSQKFSYVVGADGAHSFVRKSMSAQFIGTSYDDAFILADVELHHSHDKDYFRIYFKDKKFLAIVPMFGPNHYRLISVRRGERSREGKAPSIEEFKALICDLAPSYVIENSYWVSRFFVQCRSTNHYQDKRLFVVGDAAHIHSPAGGQGMNTGLQDAFNLAWKLALVHKGLAIEELLLTYHQERKPVGDFLIDRTDRLFKFMVKSSIWARALRRFVLPWFAKKPELINNFSKILSQTAIRYEEGARCDHTDHLCFHDVRVGERVANFLVISSHVKKTNIQALVSRLAISVLFFVPINAPKNKVKEVYQAMHHLADRYGQAVICHILFENDFHAEKHVQDGEYLVWCDERAFPKESIFIAIRPDHHVMCLGAVHEIDEFSRSVLHQLRTLRSA